MEKPLRPGYMRREGEWVVEEERGGRRWGGGAKRKIWSAKASEKPKGSQGKKEKTVESLRATKGNKKGVLQIDRSGGKEILESLPAH